jgi:hypothetical protein
MAEVSSDLERFTSKVDIDQESGCWNWTGTLNVRDGYGFFKVDRRQWSSHRWAYETLVGEVENGLHLDHLCRNRLCCNPDHLEPVTCRENLMRGETLAAANAAKTHCIHGHEFNEENTYWRRDRTPPTRMCRACSRQRARG